MRDRHIGHPKHLGLLAMIMIAAISLSSCGTMQRAGSGSEAAAQATTSFLETLRQTTAPIVDSGTLPEDPSTVYVVLQSESGTNGTADGITAYQGILRRAAVARAQGLDLKAIKVTVVNAQGTPLYGAQLPVEETIDPRWYSQPGLGESDIASAVAAAFSMSGDADAARIESVRVSKDFDGSQVLLVDASVVDVGTAWHGIQAVRHQVAAAVMELNDVQNALIAEVQIDIYTSDGKQIHRSFVDLELHREQFWTDTSVPEVQKGLDLGGSGIEPRF